MAKKEKTPPRTLVVSANRPKVTITEHRSELEITVVVPGITRRSLALTHAIVSAYLCELIDGQFDQLAGLPIRIEAGGHGSCYLARIELRRGERSPAAGSVARGMATSLGFHAKALDRAARRVVVPVGGDPTHDVTMVIL